MDSNDSDDLYDAPLDIITFENAVILTGPLGVRLAMTADAAARSAVLLLQAVERVRKSD
jgi:hypothetical protein